MSWSHASTSLGVPGDSWTWFDPPGRSFARCVPAPAAFAGFDPAHAGIGCEAWALSGIPLVLLVHPSNPGHSRSLQRAFAGAGRPGGAVDCWEMEGAAGIVWDAARGSVRLLLDLIDAETGGRRSIVPILPLDDAALAALGAAVLREPHLDAERFIETHLERIAPC